MLRDIPCTFMRAGTSRGPFFDLRDMPVDALERDEALLRIMGSPDVRQIDGLGGATPVTSKVVMVQPSERDGMDVDYLFAQVFIDKPIVDTKPTCGNMMTGVGPFAIEKGWVKASSSETAVRVYNINTDSMAEIVVQTPHGVVNYTKGETAIDGVPGVGAPVRINLFDVAGGATGKLFPTGNQCDVIDGIDTSIVDAGNLMLLLKAESFGLNGTEGKAFFDQHPEIQKTMGVLRLEAGKQAGLGDVSNSVLPRIALLSPPRDGGSVKSQYFTPHTLHPTHAVTGAIAIATACKAEDTVASDVALVNQSSTESVIIEHLFGSIPVQIEVAGRGENFTVVKAGTTKDSPEDNGGGGFLLVCGLRFAVCGLRFAVCGLRFAVCGLRFAVCGLRFANRIKSADCQQQTENSKRITANG